MKRKKKAGKKPAKKARKKTLIAAGLGILLLIAVLVFLFKQAPVQEKVPFADEDDIVTIKYILAMKNGSVIDTNDVSLAREFGLKNYPKNAYRFILGESGKVKGFDESIMGMTVGEHRLVDIPASEKVQKMLLNRTARVPMMQDYPKFTVVTIKSFEEKFGKEPVIDETVESEEFPWPFEVINKTEKKVALEYVVEKGTSYELPGNQWNSTLLAAGDKVLKFRHAPKEGQVIETPVGNAQINLGRGYFNITVEPEKGKFVNQSHFMLGFFGNFRQEYLVESYDNETITLRRINFPPQENLMLDVTLLNLTKIE